MKWSNTTGCEPAIHGFKSRIPPHKKSNGLIPQVLNLFCWHKGNFALSVKLEVSPVEVPTGTFAGIFYFLSITTER